MSSTPAMVSPGDLHDEQIVALLRTGAHAQLLMAYFGETEYRELSQLAKLAATRARGRGPIAYILPGIMGSRLGYVRRQTVNLLWLHPSAIADGGLAKLELPAKQKLKAVGVMLPGYLKMKLSLTIAGFRPIFYPFDWRADLDRLGKDLAHAIERNGSKVMIVAHSMGGLVARAALAHDRKKRIAKLVQLGAPNEGSFAPVQALRAVYPTVRKIAALDAKHDAETLARSVFRTLPGLYQLLPTPRAAGLDLFDPASWPDDGLRPDPSLLAKARKQRTRLPPTDARCYVIAGTSQETITNVEAGNGGFEYTIRRAGDGTVPLTRAVWSQAPTWYVEDGHGAMTLNNLVLSAIGEILKEGTTRRLPSTAATMQSDPVRRASDAQLRTQATRKVQWDQLSILSRRRILDPVLTEEFTP